MDLDLPAATAARAHNASNITGVNDQRFIDTHRSARCASFTTAMSPSVPSQ